MRRYLLAYSAAGIVALAVGLAAQAPASSTQSQPQSQSAATQAQVTVEGCLVNEQDVPGRKPDVVEKAGVTTDYIVTNAKMIKGTAPQSAARAGEPVGTSGTIGAPMFDVKEIDGSKLKPLVGKRVQIDGTFADLTKSATAGPTEDLVDIKATSIREVPGDCSAR